MARKTFFSFHYQRDLWRINQIRSIPNVLGSAAAGFHDASLWEEAKRISDDAIKKLIDKALDGTSVTVVFIGAQTANRKYINYEINQSLIRKNGIIGVRINHLRNHQQQVDPPGAIPLLLTAANAPIYTYTDVYDLAKWIEAAAVRAGR